VERDSSKPNPKKVRTGEDFDIIIGFLGFWALILFVLTVFREVTRKPALLPAMILLVLVLAIWGMVRWRRRLPARTARRQR
jgi:cytosine/uracil/thiamine/allantoin permease